MKEEELKKNQNIKDVPGKEEAEIWFSALAADDRYPYNAGSAFERFRTRSGIKQHKSIRLPSYWYGVAVVVLLLIVSIVSYRQAGKQLENDFATIVMEAPLGSKSKMTLPDGTIVWLNAGSRIVYSQGFGISDRHIELVGEAYFEVFKNKEKVFIVNTKELEVKVLGTKFNFRNYPEDKEVTVDLLEGRLSLDNRLKQMDTQYLSPFEKVVLNKQTGNLSILTTKAEHSKAWTKEMLFFDEYLLFDISKELERSYNVTIRIQDDSLNAFRFYGCFNRREQSIEDVLKVMSSTGRLKYEIDKDGTIILMSNLK